MLNKLVIGVTLNDDYPFRSRYLRAQDGFDDRWRAARFDQSCL